ncbi:3-keto-disaccharide hydrolase [Pseudopedobacter beijingensis]|uniref:DUF1080 domain-containing protein n=1 Tax=Pseudopedobacter beijingensis TaxID=1207056 RepID=A0ABW4IEZ4_9SPHI
MIIKPLSKRTNILFAFFLFTISSSWSQEKGKIDLFNQKNLDGWYTYIKGRGTNDDPKKVFTVANKKIRVSGEEWGCITSNEEFSDYKIIVEFKWGNETFAHRKTKAMDSGLLLHSIGKDGAAGGSWMYSIECNLIEGGTGDFIVVGDKTNDFSITSTVASQLQNGVPVFKPNGTPKTINYGRINWINRDPKWKDELGFRGEKDLEKKVGKWNKLICIAKKDSISIFLNGKLVNQAYQVKPSKGRIQIQSEGAEIFFRRIDIYPL